jgi:hypothetical protein
MVNAWVAFVYVAFQAELESPHKIHCCVAAGVHTPAVNAGVCMPYEHTHQNTLQHVYNNVMDKKKKKKWQNENVPRLGLTNTLLMVCAGPESLIYQH